MTSRTEPRHNNDARRSTLLCGCLFAVACSCGGGTTPGAGGTSGAPVTSGTGGAATGGAATTSGGTGGPTTGRPPTTSNTGTGGMTSPVGGTTGGASGTGTSTGGMSVAMGGSGGPTTTPSVEGGASVLQYHKNASRDGHYVDAAFTRAASAMMKRDTSFTAMIDGPTHAQPLYFEGGEGGKDLVITATLNNEVSAFDAANGSMVWRKTIAPPGPQGGGPGGCSFGNINPLGALGTPVIDAASKTLFVATMTTGSKHQVYALALEDGSTKPGWPADVTTVTSGSVTFNSPAQNQRGALLILNKTLYVPYGGHFGDCGDYRGWVVGIPLDNPGAPFGWVTRAAAGGVWAPNGLASDGTSVFAATGNTMAAPSLGVPSFSSPSMWGDGEGILRLTPDLKFSDATKDFFTPQDWAALDSRDLDTGGSGVVLFDVPGATPSKVAISLGKDGSAYLADQTNLGGMGGELNIARVSSSQIMQAPVAYTTPTGTFVAMRAPGMGCSGGSGAITGLKISAASPPAVSVGWCGGPTSTGSPMVTTTDGTTDSIVWYVGGGNLVGLNGETGDEIFNGESIGDTAQWQTPIAAKGRIFFAANNEVYAFKP